MSLKTFQFFVSIGLFACVCGLVIFVRNDTQADTRVQVFVANLTPISPDIITPIESPKIPNVPLDSEGGFLAVVHSEQNTLEVLYEKNSQKILPIASISKLMTAYSVIKNNSLDDIFTITTRAVEGPWPARKFYVGDTYTVKELLEAMLIESNNDAARVLAEISGEQRTFVRSMNMAAAGLALDATSFYTSDGTETAGPSSKLVNVSTAEDVARMIVQMYRKAPELLRVTTLPYAQVEDITSTHVFTAQSTNKLLPFFKNGWTLLGGKTGTTSIDARHLVLLFKDPKDVMFVAVILHSRDSFADMEKLLELVK